MKARMITTLFVTVALSLGLFSTQAEAYCDNNTHPSSYSQIIPKPNGSYDVMVSFQDREYQPGGLMHMYINGKLAKTVTNGYIQYNMPAGTGILTFDAADYDTCGTLRMYVRLPQMIQH